MKLTIDPSSSSDSGQKIQRAQAGCHDTLGQLLHDARGYLIRLAHAAFDQGVREKLSASDIVQDTLSDAHQHFQEFRGSSKSQLLAWLRRILVNNILNEYRRLRKTQKRDITREQKVDLERIAATPHKTPSRLAINQEEQAVLAEEIAQLPPHYREVIEMRHRDEMSFAAIGNRLGKTEDAARMVWYRAFDRLSEQLARRLG